MSKNNKLKITIVKISGMHCGSCDILVKRKLQKIKDIDSIEVDRSKEQATIHAQRIISNGEITEKLQGTPYAIYEGTGPTTLKKRLLEIGGILIILLPLFFLITRLEVFTNGVSVQDNMSFAVILGLGLVASVSSCIAVAGGLLLGISTRYAKQHPNLTKRQKFKPHIYFNVGRLLAYTVFGVAIGFLGSLVTLSSVATGVVTLLASVLMIIIGLQLLQLFPFLQKLQIGIPKKWSEKIIKSSEAKHKSTFASAFVLGCATFFLPCGFTQAMQLFVLGKGDPLFGGAAMFVFALGTLPSFLSIGAFASSLKKEWLHKASVVSGVIVIILGLFLLPSALTLVSSGSAIESTEQYASFEVDDALPAAVDGDVQIVNMKVTGLSYSPHQFTVKKGVPVKWIIDGSAARGCGQILTAPKLEVFERLSNSAPTIIEFTPTTSGDIPFHCSMAMTTRDAKFIVV